MGCEYLVDEANGLRSLGGHPVTGVSKLAGNAFRNNDGIIVFSASARFICTWATLSEMVTSKHS